MLSKLLQSIEKNVGTFSHYETSCGPGEKILFARKPAQQLVKGLGGKTNITPLSKKKDGQPLSLVDNPDVVVKSFEQNDYTLTVPAQRINRLLASAKIYVNTDIFPERLYHQLGCNGGKYRIEDQDRSCIPYTHQYWQNLAVGLCHVQEIDLLVEQVINQEGQAIARFRQRAIEVDAPGILLLSSPALNFGYGVAKELNHDLAKAYIEGMYRNLFDATMQEGGKYIAMPAAGLGVFNGEPDIYFKALMKIAAEYPELNIIYHPAQFGKAFDAALEAAELPNIVKATKDVLFIADELTRAGYPCAMHNPSDADVVYGVYDVGEYWKSGKGNGYVGEEHIGAMTTAPINSLGLNPEAYQKVVERSFVKAALDLPVDTVPAVEMANASSSGSSSFQDEVLLNGFQPDESSDNEDPEEEEVEIANPLSSSSSSIDEVPLNTFQPQKSSDSEEAMEPENETRAARKIALLNEIAALRDLLKDEKSQTCFFKDTKDQKYRALIRFYSVCNEHLSAPDADAFQDRVAAILSSYPKAFDGYFSKRVATLFDKVRCFDANQNLSYEQLKKVETLYEALADEADSWLCTNKALKTLKMKALGQFISDCSTMPVLEAIEIARAKESVLDGCSSRVAALFDALEEEINSTARNTIF